MQLTKVVLECALCAHCARPHLLAPKQTSKVVLDKRVQRPCPVRRLRIDPMPYSLCKVLEKTGKKGLFRRRFQLLSCLTERNFNTMKTYSQKICLGISLRCLWRKGRMSHGGRMGGWMDGRRIPCWWDAIGRSPLLFPMLCSFTTTHGKSRPRLQHCKHHEYGRREVGKKSHIEKKEKETGKKGIHVARKKQTKKIRPPFIKFFPISTCIIFCFLVFYLFRTSKGNKMKWLKN